MKYEVEEGGLIFCTLSMGWEGRIDFSCAKGNCNLFLSRYTNFSNHPSSIKSHSLIELQPFGFYEAICIMVAVHYIKGKQ